VKIHEYDVKPLTHALVFRHLSELTALANLIPEVEISPEEILADRKDDRELLGKWDHSLGVFDGDQPIAFVVGYERRGEGNAQYPSDTLYVNELSVSQDHQRQGIAKALLSHFFDYNTREGFKHLDGPFNYSIQTNSADWNHHVVALYESFGFRTRATKAYDNRTDVVMGMTPSSECIEKYKDGTIKAKGSLIDGELEGYWEWFRQDGSKMRSGHFDSGKPVGEWITYDRQSQIYKVTHRKS
jgi:GNAT superfamily N-acetyltransferase